MCVSTDDLDEEETSPAAGKGNVLGDWLWSLIREPPMSEDEELRLLQQQRLDPDVDDGRAPSHLPATA